MFGGMIALGDRPVRRQMVLEDVAGEIARKSLFDCDN
jgi:hypothetical protein